ncbi:hypothetical protein WOLCODRAFT_163623 [Wolfiporia cocos MD-104 SS10]|uniref:F-box domain-containing protein n=1 Tax=Wolfiporia cocos (strain MD-104) TaxID=742152 RepID=A0A2H3JK52_WOLCO|nr:hypothetical protein WOLCODRAFT_163623 [Wolfiporia cocos MD-104 SS10]
MGTTSYRTYRYKGRYLSYYSWKDGHPNFVGNSLIVKIPRTREKFREWLESTRQWVEARIQAHDPKGEDMMPISWWEPNTGRVVEKDICSAETISDERPEYETHSADWLYELDLDNLIFYVKGSPIFHLEHLPPAQSGSAFEASLTWDHYGSWALNADVSREYSNINHLTAPPVDERTVQDYGRYGCTSVALDELLGLNPELTPRHAVRARFLEVCVGSLLYYYTTGRVRSMELARSRSGLSSGDFKFATSLIMIGLSSLFKDGIRSIQRRFSGHIYEEPQPDPPLEGQDYLWLQRDLCVRICTHLHDRDHLQAAVSGIVTEAMRYANPRGIVYGVAFSVFHIVIVSIHKNADRNASVTVRHTPPLVFIPSPFAKSPSTPGIDALALLALRVSFDWRVALSTYYQPPAFYQVSSLLSSQEPKPLPRNDRLNKLPLELLKQIADYLTKTSDLVSFAMTSSQGMAAAESFLRYPHIGDYPLLVVKGLSINDFSPEEEYYERSLPWWSDAEAESPGHQHLWTGAFLTIKDTHNTPLVLMFGHHFTVRTELEPLRRSWVSMPYSRVLPPCPMRRRLESWKDDILPLLLEVYPLTENDKLNGTQLGDEARQSDES